MTNTKHRTGLLSLACEALASATITLDAAEQFLTDAEMSNSAKNARGLGDEVDRLHKRVYDTKKMLEKGELG